MRRSKTAILFIVTVWGLFSIVLFPLSAKAQSVDDLRWGAPVDGLQMSISTINDGDPNFPVFQIALRNIGDKDTTVNLGLMFAKERCKTP